MRLIACLVAGFTVLVPSVPLAAFARSSDPEATAMARRMIAAMGARELWANARWLYVKETAHYATRPGPGVAEYWRRFDEPGYWGRVEVSGVSLRNGWDRKAGWRFRNGVLTELTREQLQQETGWWAREVYTMYHRLAREDSALRLLKVAGRDRRFQMIDDATGDDLGWFEVDGDGAVARWHTRFGVDEVEYVYGPLKQFGPIRMPAWGTQVDGSFRFFYDAAELRTSAPEPPFQRPPAP